MIALRRVHRWTAVVLAGLLLVACGGQKEPAEKAVAEAEASIAALREDGARFAPNQLKELEDDLTQLKDNLARQNYSGVLQLARELTKRINAVNETIASEKANADALATQLTERWNTLSTELPDMVKAVNARVTSLAKTRKFPEGIDAASFENVKAAAKTMSDNWTQALAAFANNNMQEAVDMAQMAKDKGTEVMNALGMTPPAPAPAPAAMS